MRECDYQLTSFFQQRFADLGGIPAKLVVLQLVLILGDHSAIEIWSGQPQKSNLDALVRHNVVIQPVSQIYASLLVFDVA